MTSYVVLAQGEQDTWKPGIFDCTREEYHADICDRPSLTASIAAILCASSPRHAWTAHPKLNPKWRPAEEQKFDIGTAAHALLLQGEEVVALVVADDWRTKAAKEQRDLAREVGQVPLLVHQWEAVRAMAGAAREQFAHHHADPPLFTDGKPEQTLVWEEPGGVMCRARLDWLRDDLRTVDDLKTTSASANPERWTRTMLGMGADLQAAFYLRGVEAVTGRRPEFRFVVVETYPPFALSVVSLAPSLLALAESKVDYALDLWRTCLARDEWPAYPADVAYAELPAWEESRWLEREAREAA